MKFQFDGEVARPPTEVFAFIGNIEREHEWVSEVMRSRKTSPGPTDVGTTYIDVVRFMGRTSEIPTVITAWEPGRRLAYRHTDGPIKGELSYSLASTDSGTSMQIDIDAEVPFYLRLLGPLLRSRLASQMDGNFVALRKALDLET